MIYLSSNRTLKCLYFKVYSNQVLLNDIISMKTHRKLFKLPKVGQRGVKSI